MPDPEVKLEPKFTAPTEVKVEVPLVETKVEAKVEPKVESKTEVKTEVLPPEVKVVPKSDWRDARIAELTAKLNQAKAAKVELPKGAAESEEQFNARVESRAKVLADEALVTRTFNERCTDAAKSATTAHPDFTERFNQVKSVINGADEAEVVAYNSVLAAALETPNPGEVLYDLSADPGEFRRIMSLPPVRMGVELATRAAKLGVTPPAPEPSALPKPITPIGSRGEHYEGIAPDDANRGTKLPLKEWMARREAQVKERGLQ